jgi:hypothetical protein
MSMTTGATDLVDQLSDRQVYLALEEIAHELTVRHPHDAGSAAEAMEVLAALGEAGEAPLPPGRELGDIRVARRLLAAFAEDPTSGEFTLVVLGDPPDGDVMAPGELVENLVVLAAVIGFLRLRLNFRFERKEGRNLVKFEVEQKPASDSLLRSLARTVADYFQQR